MESRELAYRMLSAAGAASGLARRAAAASARAGVQDEIDEDLDDANEALVDELPGPLTGTAGADAADIDTYQPPVPSAFISWAHKHSSMTPADAQEWERQVAEFATDLRQIGIDVDVDLYHLDDPEVDWTRFGPDAVRNQEFILIAASPAWRERWEGTNHPAEGAGAAAEADALKGLFHQDQLEFQRRVKVILLPGQDASSSVPVELWRLTRYEIDPDNPDSPLPLLRAMTGQPLYVKPPLGAVPILPAAFEKSISRRGSSARRRGRNDLAWVLAELRSTTEQVAQLESSWDDGELPDEQHLVELRALQSRQAALQGVVDALAQESN